MRAWQVLQHGEPEQVLRKRDVPAPPVAPDAVRIRVRAAALGLPDVFMCRGTYPLTPSLPFSPGQEVAGLVDQVGRDVDPSILGSRVMAVTAFYEGHGGLAEQTVAPAANAFPVPGDMSDADAAAFFIPFHTAWIALHRRARLMPGESLLVLGAAGGTGSAAVQLGRALGARVIAVAGGASKGEFCASCGAHDVIDHRTENVAERVRASTSGRGVDVVFDPVGGASASGVYRTIANEGRVLLVGFASGDWALPRAQEMVVGNFSVLGVYAGAYDRQFRDEAHASLLELFGNGSLKSIVTVQAGFDELPRALARLADRSATGKTVLVVERAGGTNETGPPPTRAW